MRHPQAEICALSVEITPGDSRCQAHRRGSAFCKSCNRWRHVRSFAGVPGQKEEG